MFNRKFWGILIFCLILPVNSWASELSTDKEKIGSLRKVTGESTITRTGQNEQIKGSDGLAIYQNDLITTESDASLGIVFKDGSRISLGPNSKLEVNQYVFNPSQKKYSMLSKMSKGTLSFRSGKLSKLAPGSVSFQTPDATIASRGTSFLIVVE